MCSNWTASFSLIPLDIFQMVAEAATQSLVEQQEEQVSVQEVQELKDSLSQSEVKTKTLENQVENLQKVRTEQAISEEFFWSLK